MNQLMSNKICVRLQFSAIRVISTYLLLSILLFLRQLEADSKVPMVTVHEKQIRLRRGDKLRLECPIQSTASGKLKTVNESLGQHYLLARPHVMMYHWKVHGQLDYALNSDPRYKFSQNRRVLEVTEPIDSSDSGPYTCTGITGFGKREVTFNVHVRAPCFIDPDMKRKESITFEKPIGSSVSLNCEADGSEPIRYRWFMGKTVADWIKTAEGARGPVLRISELGREHTGHYTCQVANMGGSLNYTYRLVVTDLPSAAPKIVSFAKNQTFASNEPATLEAHIQCSCEQPLIQWLKRIEPDQASFYNQPGIAKIPLPNARESEIDEMYAVLGQWSGSPGVVENISSYSAAPPANHFDNMHSSEPFDYYIDNRPRQSSSSASQQNNNKIFVTRLRLKEPLEKERHDGKYVVMTMSLSDVKSMEYAVTHVTIIPDPAFLQGRRLLLYFLIPFCLVFAILGLLSYLFIYRNRRYGRSSSGNNRCILGASDFTSNHHSHTAYKPMFSPNGYVKKPAGSSSYAASSSGRHPLTHSSQLQSPFSSNDSRSSTQAGPFVNTQQQHNQMTTTITANETSLLPQPYYTKPVSNQSSVLNSLAYQQPPPHTQPSMGYPGVHLGNNGHSTQPQPPHPFYVSQPSTNTTNHNAALNVLQFKHQPTPTDDFSSLDQYSAVGHETSISGLTPNSNHYTAPFNQAYFTQS